MNNIKKFEEYFKIDRMVETFLKSFETPINESDSNKDYETELKRMKGDIKGEFKINIKLITTFGAGIGSILPIVDNLMKNSSFELDTRSIILLTIAGISMILIDESKYKKDNKNIKIANEYEELVSDTRNIMSELKLCGFPNAGTGTNNGSDNSVLNKVVNTLKAIYDIYKKVKTIIIDSKFSKHISRGVVTTFKGFSEMLSYSAMLIPVMNGINAIIGTYDVNMETFLQNSISFISGLGIIVAKHGVSYLIAKLKNFLNLSKEDKDELKNEIDNTDIRKLSDTNNNSNIINENS